MSEDKWDLSRLTTGERCALRRAAGSLEPNMPAWRAFYLAGGGRAGRHENYWYAAMCMACMWRPEDEERARMLPMEQCLRLYLRENESVTESMKRRMDALLETPWSEDGFLLTKLHSIVRILQRGQTDLRPNFQALADDLRDWNRDDRRVQRRWLRATYVSENDEPKTEGGDRQ